MDKETPTQKIRETSRAIIDHIGQWGKRSVRRIAGALGRSKSAVHRHLQAQARRDQHPESPFWETEAGETWLRLFFFAVLYSFGLECGVGAEKLSRFFHLIRLNDHIGVSPTALRAQLSRMEALLPQFQEQCEQQAGSASRKAVMAMDETFFREFMILVLTDLNSGYLLMEDVSDDRCFETWYQKAAPRLKSLGIEVVHAISDRAKALIKLAIDGFHCATGADLFHAQQDISRWLGARLSKRVASAEKAYEALPQNTGEEEKNKALESVKAAKQVQEQYLNNLQGIADDLHPFKLEDSTVHNAWQVESALKQRRDSVTLLADEQEIKDSKSTARKFTNQIEALASSVNAWWLWVHELLQDMAPDKPLRDWLTTTLLPVVYWHYQRQRTQNPDSREKYQRAWEYASEVLKQHAFTLTLSESEMQHWLVWAEWMVRQFHRSSSAVEGRNGRLSQMHHNGRGLTLQRLKALTVIHNYGLRHQDGTTAAMRLFSAEFPDLFSWLVAEMGALPLPRKGRQRTFHNPLELLSVPA